MLTRTLQVIGIAGIVAGAAACQADAGDVEASSSDSGIVLGSTITSPNANPQGAYLKARSLDSLVRLGALPGDLGRLAARADGTLVAAQADGTITLDELLALEKKENLAQLVPQERAVLPDLWKLFETTKESPSELTLTPLEVIDAVDISDPATELVEPTSILLTSLKTELERVARRLQQAHDSDDDPKTITQADITAVLAAPTGFQPWELAQIRTIRNIFRDRGTTKLVARARVTPPVKEPYTLPKSLEWGNISLGIGKTIEYRETRVMDTNSQTLTVKLVGRGVQNVKLKATNTQKVLIIDDATGKETFAVSGVLELDAGTKTVEVWEGNRRTGSYRSKLPKLTVEETTVDLTRFADFNFVLEDGKAVKRLSVDGEQTGNGFNVTYQYAMEGYDAVSEPLRKGAANPPFEVPFGRYVLPATGGPITLELYPEGILKITRPNGVAERAVYRNRVWVSPETSDLEFLFDSSTNSVTIRKADETLLFQGALTGALRAG